MRTVAAIVFCFLIGAGLVVGLFRLGELRPTPPCEEDQVLVGEGNFDGDRYDYYVCGPAFDDYK